MKDRPQVALLSLETAVGGKKSQEKVHWTPEMLASFKLAKDVGVLYVEQKTKKL